MTGKDFPITTKDKTFLTIRNVPYTELDVIDVKSQSRKILAPNSKTVLVTDPSQPSLFDAIITITDNAKITKDGAVVGGNKIKMGLPVTLEGKTYRFNGTISDVKVKTDVHIEDDGENNNIS